MQCVYSITNIKNGKRYIGSTVSFNKRKNEHLKRLRGNYHHSIVLQRAFNKYGEVDFIFQILEPVSNFSKLLAIEQKHIDFKSEYNSSKVAGNASNNNNETLVCDINGNYLGEFKSRREAYRLFTLTMCYKKAPFYFKHFLFFDKGTSTDDILLFVSKNKNKMKRIKPIYQFDDNLLLIKKWESISYAIKYYGNANFNCGITNAIKNKKRAFGFYWSYSESLNDVFIYKGHKKKAVNVFKNGIKINEFKSITECAKYMNDQKINIIKVCKKQKNHSKNYYYEYQ